MQYPVVDLLYCAHGRRAFTLETWDALREFTNWSRVAALYVMTDGDDADFLDGFDLSSLPVIVNTEPCGGPVGAIREYLKLKAAKPDAAEAFVKIDNDLVVCPGWLERLLFVAENNPEFDLIGIEPWCPELQFLLNPELAVQLCDRWVKGIAEHRHVGGIGLFRLACFFGHGKPDFPEPERGGRFGWTEWQWNHPGFRKGFLNPPLPIFLLDHIPVEPWLSLSKKYVLEGVQRQPWAQYPKDFSNLWDWWIKANDVHQAFQSLPVITLAEAFVCQRPAVFTSQQLEEINRTTGNPDFTPTGGDLVVTPGEEGVFTTGAPREVLDFLSDSVAIEAAAADQGFGLVQGGPSTWSDEGWVESDAALRRSPCHQAKIFYARTDDVSMGTCAECHAAVVRINPATGNQEVPKEHRNAAN